MKPDVARRAIAGALLALVGSFTLAGLVFLIYSHDRTAERALFALGIAPAALVSATAQVLVLAGLWLLWTAARRAGR